MLPPRRGSILDGGVGSDSDSDDDALQPEGVYYAQRLKYRLNLRRWESEFRATHGRAAEYEDKKLDPSYQRLRSELRQVELAWRTEQQREGHEDFGETPSIHSSRSGQSSRSGLSSRSGRSSQKHRGSIQERERSEA